MPRSERDPYAILGVPRGASRTLVAAAYRRLARRLHPDAGAAESEAMRDLNWAWGVLSDADRRADWDQHHAARAAGHWAASGAPSPSRPASSGMPGWAASGEPWSGGRTVPAQPAAAGVGCLGIGIAALILCAFVLFGALSSGLLGGSGEPGEAQESAAPQVTGVPAAP